MNNGYQLKYSICIEMMFSEFDFYDRVEASVNCGFTNIEIWHWANHDMSRLEEKLSKFNANVIMTNPSNPQDKDINSSLWKGILSVDADNAVLDAVEATLPICRQFGCNKLVMLPGDRNPNISFSSQYDRLQRILDHSASLMAKHGITLLFEPLCLASRPNSFISRAQEGLAIIREIDKPNIQLLYDLYHQQVMEGNLITTIRDNLPQIGHIHVADAPYRLPPGKGEINIPNILRVVAEAGFSEFVGLEYNSNGSTAETIDFLV